MDPVSILGLITTAGTIASAITRTIRDLSDLRAQYTDADLRVRLLIKELSTIKSSLTQINDWAHFLDTTDNQAELRDALQVALDGVELAMGALAEEVQKLVPDPSATSRVDMGYRQRTRYVWNEDTMKEHENRLRAQVSALQLLLQAAQCPSRQEQAELLQSPQNRQIIKKVEEDSITLRATMSAAGSRRGPPTILSDDNATTDQRVFDWDDEIVNAATYRRALQHYASKRNVSDHPAPMNPRIDLPLRLDTDSIRDLPSTPTSERPWESRPLPYENSVVSEPVEVHERRKHTYHLGRGTRSDVIIETRRGSPHRERPSESGKKKFWAALTPKRSTRNLEPPVLSTRTPSNTSSNLSYRGKRGLENSTNASIDFGSENGLSAPSLVRAAQAGSVVEVETLLNQGADIESIHQQSGRNALAVASHCGNESVVQLLLRYGANVNTPDVSSFCPSHLAAMRGHYGVVELLLQEHARIDEPGPNGETPLRIASDKGYIEIAELLLRAKAKVNARDMKRMSTPLHTAAKNGDEAMIDLLIRHGAHLEAKDGELMTPLHYACEAGRDRAVLLLLNRKANIEVLGRRGMTPLVCAAAAGQNQVVEVLCKKRASIKHTGEGSMTALHWACYNGHYEVADFLLDKRAPPNFHNKDGRTPLHLAIMANHFAVAELLLRKGASVEMDCGLMRKPIHYACLEGSPEILKLLLGYNANAEAESTGRRPLHIAAAQGLTPIADVLLTRGVDIDARDSAGDRALGLACRMGHLAIVRMLLVRGSPLRSKFAKGPSHEDSPLCLAARGGHTVIVHELLNRGTSVNQRDEQNWTPLRYASHYARPQVVEVLLKAGAAISGVPSSGWGFDVTARRIGFADEVFNEHERKAKCLQLLIDAESKEKKIEETLVPSPPSYQPNQAPAELVSSPVVRDRPAGIATDSPPPQAQPPAENPRPLQRPPSELDTRWRSNLSPPATAGNNTSEPTSGYPSSAHIANAYGFDPYPQGSTSTRPSAEHRRFSYERKGKGPSSATPEPPVREPPAPPSAVHIGPDGMWRVNPTHSSQAVDGSQSIYEMGSYS
ncbi:MAG: hypothetical protein L6R37_003948 [Teloschistes peruensis]|nr:MAG: hypothetical protein L6R37_003948 [Teloschistes peruensis]